MNSIERHLQKQIAAAPSIFGVHIDAPTLIHIARADHVVLTSSTLFYTGEVVVNQCFTVQDQREATRGEALFIAGSMAGKSRNPLFMAVRRGAEQVDIPLREIDTDPVPGGVVGALDRTWYVLGTAESMAAEGIDLGVAGQTLARQLEQDGLIPLFLSQKRPKQLIAIFALLRKTDPAIRLALTELFDLGVQPTLFTDQPPVVISQLIGTLPFVATQSIEDASHRAGVFAAFAAQYPRSLFVCTTQTIRQLPKNVVGLAPKAVDISLVQLPEIMRHSRDLLSKAHKRFFWVRFPE